MLGPPHIIKARNAGKSLVGCIAMLLFSVKGLKPGGEISELTSIGFFITLAAAANYAYHKIVCATIEAQKKAEQDTGGEA